MLKGNKGEWSEYYAFLKLLSDGRLDFGDPKFEKIENKFYPILKVVRIENGEKKSYKLLEGEKVDFSIDEKKVTVIDVSDLKEKVKEVFKIIDAESETTFEIEAAKEFEQRFNSVSLNAGNQSKEDLALQIHDDITGTEPEIGFSIKSMVGSAATLLNASGATNFIYEIKNLPKGEIDHINKIDTRSKIMDRIGAIEQASGIMEYSKMESNVFMRNLRLCDTVMPEIIAQMLLIYYRDGVKLLQALVDSLVAGKFEFSGFGIDRTGFEHKIQNLLYAIALGMVPNSEWDGLVRAQGGYIIVRGDGELVGYTLYDADVFKKYLLRNTKLETPSSKKHGFGTVYEESGKMFIKLNLQIRFVA